MGRSQKARVSKTSTVLFVTPQPNAPEKRAHEKLQKSEPPAKRKKLAQELDEEISDSEFDAQLDRMRTTEKQLKENKVDNLKGNKDKAGSDGEDEDDEEDSEDAESDGGHAEHVCDDDSDDGDETEDDSDSEDDESDYEETDLDDQEDFSSEDEVSEGDDDNSHIEHEDPGVKKSLAKSQAKKTKAGSKKKSQKKKTEEDIPIEATEMAQDLIAKASRDKRTLFLKNLPTSVTADKIKSFSSDVLEVRIQTCRAKKSRNIKCAFVEFIDEKTAVRNKTTFEHKTIDDSEISVDFVGEKSTFKPNKPQFPTSVDPRKLYISGIGKESTIESLKKLFPTASSVDFPHYKKEDIPKGYAFIHFADEKTCRDAHAAMQNQVISGRALTVMYAKKSLPESKGSKKNLQSSNQPRKNKKAASESIEKKENGTERDINENADDSSENDGN